MGRQALSPTSLSAALSANPGAYRSRGRLPSRALFFATGAGHMLAGLTLAKRFAVSSYAAFN